MIELKGQEAREWFTHRCTRAVRESVAADRDAAHLALLSACQSSTDSRVAAAAARYQLLESLLKATEPKPGEEDDSD